MSCRTFCTKLILIKGLTNPNQSSEKCGNTAKFAMNVQEFSVKLHYLMTDLESRYLRIHHIKIHA